MSTPQTQRTGRARGQADSGESPQGTTARAERLVSGAGEKTEDWVQAASQWASRALARAREEAEDIWAEAQAIRRRQ